VGSHSGSPRSTLLTYPVPCLFVPSNAKRASSAQKVSCQKLYKNSSSPSWLSHVRSALLSLFFYHRHQGSNIVKWLNDFRWGLDWQSGLLNTAIHNPWLHFTKHCHTHASVLSHCLHCSAWWRIPTAVVSLLPGSRPCRPTTISHQLPSQCCREARPTVSRPVCLCARYSSGTFVQFYPFFFLIIFRQLKVCWCGRPFWRKVGSVVFSCCWASPAQSSSGLSRAGPMIFYCLNVWDPTSLNYQVPAFTFSKKRIVQLYLQVFGCSDPKFQLSSLYSFGTEYTEDNDSKTTVA
jgi:hypothetical protein